MLAIELSRLASGAEDEDDTPPSLLNVVCSVNILIQFRLHFWFFASDSLILGAVDGRAHRNGYSPDRSQQQLLLSTFYVLFMQQLIDQTLEGVLCVEALAAKTPTKESRRRRTISVQLCRLPLLGRFSRPSQMCAAAREAAAAAAAHYIVRRLQAAAQQSTAMRGACSSSSGVRRFFELEPELE